MTLYKFQCPKCKDIHEKPSPVLVAHRCERGVCTYAALEPLREPADAPTEGRTI